MKGFFRNPEPGLSDYAGLGVALIALLSLAGFILLP